MAACQCSVCGGPVGPGSDLEKLDLFDLKVADGHLVAPAVQRLRPLLLPDTNQRLCSSCASVLAHRQRLLTQSLLAEAETELDAWVADLMPNATEKPPSAAARTGDESEEATQGGVVSQAVNQADNVTGCSEVRSYGITDSPVVKMEGAHIMAVIQLDSVTGSAVVTLEGAPDLVVDKLECVGDPGVVKSEVVVGPAAIPWDNVIAVAGDNSDDVTGVRSEGVVDPAEARLDGVTSPAGARLDGAAGPAGCRCGPTCARCLAGRAAAGTAAGLERHLAAIVSAASRRRKDTGTKWSAQDDIATGLSYVLKCRLHNVQACPVCKMTVGPSKSAELHLPDDKHGRRECPLCPKCVCEASGAAKATTNNSARTDSQSIRFRCDICDINLQNMMVLLRHLECHNAGEYLHPGKSCTGAAKNTANVSVPTGSKSNRFRCDICDVNLQDMALLLRHLERHNAKKRIRRTIPEKPRTNIGSCDAVTSKPSSPQPSSSSSPQPSSSSSSCTDANKKKRVKSFACSQCGATFETRYNVKRHQAVHSDARPFSCPHCMYTAKTQDGLGAHRKKHVVSREKVHPKGHVVSSETFLCKMCNVKLSDQFALRHHQCDGRRFVCPDCGLRFPDEWKLKRHGFTHTGGPRPCCCHLCPASFNDIFALKTHMEYHDPKTDWQCKRCPARFLRRRAGALSSHMRIVHKEEMSGAPVDGQRPSDL